VSRLRRVTDERGSILITGAGLIAVCLLAVAVLVDASSAFVQRQQLFALADAAALAGAQAIDLDAYYAEGASAATRLDIGAVPGRVRAHLTRARAAEAVTGLAVDGISSDGSQVVVALSAPLRLPFLSGLTEARVAVEARSQLAYLGSG
jgi:threonine dehydrogenase-like Zn-dependent dehydrogenase